MDAITLLTADHNRLRGLFTQFRDAKDASDLAEMTRVVAGIFLELDVHTTIEEEIFYRATRHLSTEVADLVDEGFEEHHVIKVLTAEMQMLDVASPAWIAKMTVLIENVEHHVEEEESDLFPKIRANTTADDRRALAEHLDDRKGDLGAPKLAETMDLTDKALRQLASEQAIPGRSKMGHDARRRRRATLVAVSNLGFANADIAHLRRRP